MNRSSTHRMPLLALTVAALVVTGACSNGNKVVDSSLPEGATTSSTSTPITTITSTTSSSAPSTSRVPNTTATTRRTTQTTAPQPGPRVVASPTGAGPETRISIRGEGFLAENWRTPNVPLWLAGGPAGCDFFADADHDVRVTADGDLSGWFVVPSHGACRQSSTGDAPVVAGHYRIVYQCTACTIGEFTVTESAPPATARCKNVGFAPNSDNLASDIVAYGVSCQEAEAVVREVGGPLGPINGAPRGEAGGFTCVRISQSDSGLPSAEYTCTRGGQRITFTRT